MQWQLMVQLKSIQQNKVKLQRYMKYHSPNKNENAKVNITFSYVTTPQQKNKQNCSPSHNISQCIDQFTPNRKPSLKDIKFKCIKCGKTAHDQDMNQSHPKCSTCKQKDNPMDGFIYPKSPKCKTSPYKFNKNQALNLKSKPLSSKSKEIELQFFLREVQKQSLLTKEKLIEVHKKEQSIIEIFDDKRNYLKNHYEKIRNALEEAMMKDITSLKDSQNQELSVIQEEQANLRRDLSRLEGIKQDIEPNIRQIAEKVQQKRYNEFLSKYKQQVKRISSINLSRVSSNLTITASIEDKESFYDSSLFRILEGAQQHKTSRSQSFVMAANSGIFFSFQKKKL